jgi:hypothetical protein
MSTLGIRRQSRISIALALGMMAAGVVQTAVAESGTSGRVVVEKIDHVGVCVSDLKRATAAYEAI